MNENKAIFRPYTQKACNLRRSVPGDAICLEEEKSSKEEEREMMGRYLTSAIAAVRVGTMGNTF